MLKCLQPVAICDQFSCLILCELKTEMYRETLYITFYLLIETFGIHSVQPRQVAVKHNLLATDYLNKIFYLFQWL